jgi:D-alanine-D-alanine ligase
VTIRTVAVLFGGRSVEHEVSVITAHQVMAALPTQHFAALPVYIAKTGIWYTGDVLCNLRLFSNVDQLLRQAQAVVPAVDAEHAGVLWRHGAARPGRLRLLGTDECARFEVAFPLVHGSHGEDGTLQGLLELADTPYVGCGVTAAALGMDKVLQRRLFRAAGLPVLDDIVLARSAWRADPAGHLRTIRGRFEASMVVKPATLGSSIGVSRADSEDSLRDAIDLACHYDDRVVIEPEQHDATEINCSVLGTSDRCRPSVCEQPVKSGLLTYAAKYAGGSKAHPPSTEPPGTKRAGLADARRLIPAPIDDTLTRSIQLAATTAFSAIGAEGVARVDFLVRPDERWFVVNEINTVPGSLAFYLWEASGVPFAQLLTELLALADRRQEEKRRTTFSIDDWLLRTRTSGAAKRHG